MKLKTEFERFAELYRQGFVFNPDDHIFYAENVKEFKHPEGFEDWKVEKFERDSYLKERLKEMGVKTAKIELIGGVNLEKNERAQHEIFTANKRGDIQILQYSLSRVPYTYMELGAKNTSASNREKYHEQTRLHPIHEYIAAGKYDFSRAKNVPFWPPALIEEFEAEKKSHETLIITEGQLKAFKGSVEGLPVVGLTSISHFKSKETGTIHQEIIEYIKTCDIRKVVILWDGDCRSISDSALRTGEDLSTRPHQFFSYAKKIRDMIQEFNPGRKLSIYFATIKSDEIEGHPKGLDDLFIETKVQKKEILRDFSLIGEMPGKLIHWINITQDSGVKKLISYFNLNSEKAFYEFHREKIRESDFVFRGTTYKIEDGHPLIKVSASLKQYKRIGTDFYRIVKEPIPIGKNGDKILEETLIPWTSAAITLDHGKSVLEHIEKFLGFTNYANHVDYQQVIDGHWNLYQNIDHTPVEAEWPYIQKLLKHLFEEQYTMALDYITLLYRHPFQKLPVVCLVSKEQKTGKSTFVYLLKLLFKQNMAIISNNDLLSEFNSHWISKLIVASEETMLEKKDAYEKIKSISTQKSILRNEKNKTAREIPCMVHFVFCSNHENDFIKIDDYDSRLWIRKVKTISERIKGFDEKIANEIPAFVDFIQKREIEYEDVGERLYFDPKDFKTEAFYNVVKHSEPGIIKEIRTQLTELFLVTDATEIHMTTKDIKNEFSIRQDHNYINKEIGIYLKAERACDLSGNPKVSTYCYYVPDPVDPDKLVKRAGKGRYYIFKREDFTSVLAQNQRVQTDLIEQLS